MPESWARVAAERDALAQSEARFRAALLAGRMGSWETEDATEHKGVEELLRLERERFALALTAGQMGAFEMDFIGNSLWWSPQMYGLFGVDPARFQLTPESVLTLLHADDAQEFVRVRRDAIHRHRPFVFEFRVQRDDGPPPWLHLRGQAAYDPQGKPLRSFGVVMDITERKQFEQVLRAADRNKDDFIAIVAHELRNPLAPIRNALHVLRHNGAPDATATWCHEVLERQVGHMTRLLDDLLDVSRLSRGQLRLQRAPMGLAAAIDLAVETAKPVIEAGRHALSVSLPQTPLPVDGDLLRLAQVFSNVLINAAKYTPSGGQITVTALAQDGHAIVRVADTGIGIAADDVPRIFEIFGQAKSAIDRAQGGQGIGLALAKGLIEMHGGSIQARSEGLGRGSEFVLRLPLH